MLLDGLTIMLLGMGTVFFFLIALTTLISLLSLLFRSHAATEEARLIGESAAKRKRKSSTRPGGAAPAMPSKKPDEAITAVISAALTAHRSR